MLCAIVIIDSAATERLVKLEQTAERFGIPPQDVHGHVTLATYVGDDEDAFISSCKSILSDYRKFPVYYDAIEAWVCKSGMKSLIVAAPRKEPVIVAIQREISRSWSADLNDWTREERWRPHTSLLYVQGADLSPVAEAMQEEFEPFVTQADRIEFSRVLENGYEVVDFVELQ